MAAIPQQRTDTEEKSPARLMWNRWIEKHPTIHGILNVIGSLFGFFFNGHFVVAIGHWLVVTAGRIAETALLLATLWVTAANVAPDLVAKVGTGNATTLSSLSLIAFSLLPEIIVFSAIIVTYEHWTRFFRDRRATNPAWVWAILYSLPTSSFVLMTILTISSFVSNNGTAAHATGTALVARCLSGWFYSLVELIYASIGRRTVQTITPRQMEDRLAEIVATTRATIEQQVAAITTTTQQQLNNQVAHMQQQVAAIHTDISRSLSHEIAQIQETIQQQVTLPAEQNNEARSITVEQFERLVGLINQQQRIIQHLSGQVTQVSKETRTAVTEIREIRSFTQEQPVIGTPAAFPILSAGTTVEANSQDEQQDAEVKPGPRVLRFLQECQQRGYKPKLKEIQERCQVAKRTATTYRDLFYGNSSASSQVEDTEDESSHRDTRDTDEEEDTNQTT